MLTVALLTVSLSLSWGTEPMRSLTIYEGLGGESVYSICQTRNGMVWFATTDGVTSYDGNETVTYRLSGEHKTQVAALATTRDGRLWAGSTRGLLLVNARRDGLTIVDKALSQRVNCLTAVGDTVIAGTDAGLFIYAGRRMSQHWLTRDHLSFSNRVQDVEPGPHGGLWVLCDGELYRYSLATGKALAMGLRRQLRGVNDMRVMAATATRLFIGTYNHGLYVYDIKSRKIEPYIDCGCRVITCLSVDKGGNLYVGTDGAGLRVVSLATDQTTAVYDMSAESRYRLLDNTVYSFFRTTEGVCFFGYYRRGVHYNYHVTPLFHCYRTSAFDSRGVNIRSLSIADDIKVLGSRGGLYLVDERRGRCKFFSPEELGGSIVTNVVRYQGQFYCCTFNGGVMRINPTTLTTSRFGSAETLRWGSFGSLVVSPDDKLWMSGNAGIFVYDGKTGRERVYDSRNSRLSPGYVNNLLFDRQRRCWISSAAGLALYDPLDGTIRTQGFPTGFFNSVVETTGVLGDKDNLLFSCNDGLYRTNEELTVFGPVDTRATIGNDYVSQVVYDPRHRNYWLGTERGLFRFDATFRHVAKFGQQVGLTSREFSTGAIVIDEHNRLWTGTVDGLFSADLDSLARYAAGSQLVNLSEATRDKRPLSLAERELMLRERTIRLTYNFGTETFSFLPMKLDFSDPEGQCYEYRVGGSGEWHVLKNREHAVIDHGLGLGKTTLEVRLAGQRAHTHYYIYVWPSAAFVCEVLALVALLAALVVATRQRIVVVRQREEMARVQRELEETRRKYARVTTTDAEQERLTVRLEAYMKQERPYLNADLRLSDVAARLGVSTVKLSQYFNIYLSTNYYDYINRRRLDEFKQRLGQPRYARYTLMALAEECGFRRSAFFATFKKVDGITPTEYARQQGH